MITTIKLELGLWSKNHTTLGTMYIFNLKGKNKGKYYIPPLSSGRTWNGKDNTALGITITLVLHSFIFICACFACIPRSFRVTIFSIYFLNDFVGPVGVGRRRGSARCAWSKQPIWRQGWQKYTTLPFFVQEEWKGHNKILFGGWWYRL